MPGRCRHAWRFPAGREEGVPECFDLHARAEPEADGRFADPRWVCLAWWASTPTSLRRFVAP
eukprot:305634-Pyramimonas_sp.AAC.1